MGLVMWALVYLLAFFVIFGKVIAHEIVVVSGLANVHCRFGRSACVIVGLGAGMYTQMEVFLLM